MSPRRLLFDRLALHCVVLLGVSCDCERHVAVFTCQCKQAAATNTVAKYSSCLLDAFSRVERSSSSSFSRYLGVKRPRMKLQTSRAPCRPPQPAFAAFRVSFLLPEQITIFIMTWCHLIELLCEFGRICLAAQIAAIEPLYESSRVLHFANACFLHLALYSWVK